MTRLDHRKICSLITDNAKVLDLGCGNGDLLQLLRKNKNTEGSGIEISPTELQEAIAKGLSVIQGNLEEIIKDYPDQMFDYCILSQTLQDLKHPEETLLEMVRVGKKAIVAFWNLAYWQYRIHILFRGTFPKSSDLPYGGFNANIAFLSVSDFENFCKVKGINIIHEEFISKDTHVRIWPNLRAKLCVFEISAQN